MTRKEQVDALGPYVRDIADRLGLRDWTVELKYEPTSNSGHNAEVSTIRGRKQANVWVCFDFFDKAPEEQRHSVCHELIHLHFCQSDDFLDPLLSESQVVSFDLLREYGVDAMADAIAPHMPFPDAPALELTETPRNFPPPPI